ncbi:MAG: hypothetical protein ACOZBL_05070 [Patescibacteria group bacterium]
MAVGFEVHIQTFHQVYTIFHDQTFFQKILFIILFQLVALNMSQVFTFSVANIFRLMMNIVLNMIEISIL